jgi:hypothetical protein
MKVAGIKCFLQAHTAAKCETGGLTQHRSKLQGAELRLSDPISESLLSEMLSLLGGAV